MKKPLSILIVSILLTNIVIAYPLSANAAVHNRALINNPFSHSSSTEDGDEDTEKPDKKSVKEYWGEKIDKAGDTIDSAKKDFGKSLDSLKDNLEDMNDKGVQLFVERTRSVDTISFVENLVNSIANRPKSFDAAFDEIDTNRSAFLNSRDFGERELQAAREAVGGAGAGLAAGASVAFMGPTAAMWVATTFGTASTGTAISTLSGAAATNAALAWLGGGALAAEGGGMAAGSALLAMAGPIGWTIAGATLLTSILIFAKKKTKLNKQKNEEIETVKRNTEKIREMDVQINVILTETVSVRSGLNDAYTDCLDMFGQDYTQFSADQKQSLGALVNHAKTLSALFKKTVSC